MCSNLTYLGFRHEVTVRSLVWVLALQPQFLGLLLQALFLLCAGGVDLPLGAHVGLGHPGGEDREEAQQEGEDGGEEETPPFPLVQTLLVVNQWRALTSKHIRTQPCLGLTLTYVWSRGLHTLSYFHSEDFSPAGIFTS